MGQIILSAIIKYVESHPDVVEKLIEQAFQAIVIELAKHNATAPAA